MSRTSRLIPALVFACVLAACGEAGNTPVGPDGPSLDSGVGAMGGNREGEEPPVTTSSTAPDSTVQASGVGAMGGN